MKLQLAGHRNLQMSAGLLVITATGALIRSLGLDRDLWSDEAATLVIVHWPVWELATQPRDETPFLYYALHKLFLAGADTPAQVRLLAFGAGAVAIPAMFFAAKAVFGGRSALIAAALLAVWPLHIQYSQEARAHSLLFLFVLISAGGLLAWAEERRLGRTSSRARISLLLFGFFSLLSFYTHLLSLFWIAIAIPAVILVASRYPAARREALICTALIAVAAAPGIHWLWMRLAVGHP